MLCCCDSKKSNNGPISSKDTTKQVIKNSTSPIVNNNKVIGGNARIYIKKKVFIHVEFLDTYMHIPHKLADFSKMFNLKAEKEIMIYDIYTEESIKKKYMDEKYFLEQVKKGKKCLLNSIS